MQYIALGYTITPDQSEDATARKQLLNVNDELRLYFVSVVLSILTSALSSSKYANWM